jgi:hypothetical protein
MQELSRDDVAHVLTVLHDLRAGYAERELASGWREAADRLADALGRDDPRDWPRLSEADK